MIHSFTCKNFYSFSDQTAINFVVDGNAPNNNGYFPFQSGVRSSKVIAVIGPNASGKTHILKVLPLLKFLITDSFMMNPNQSLPVEPFAFRKKRNELIEFSVVFEIDGKVYTYALSLTQKRIISEKLQRQEFIRKKISKKLCFSRTWDPQKKCYNLLAKGFGLPKNAEDLLRSNASAISTMARLNHPESRNISTLWQQLRTNVVASGWMGDRIVPDAIINQFFAAISFYRRNKDIKEEAEELLKRFDLGLSGFDISKEKTDEGVAIKCAPRHLIDGREYTTNMKDESSGTKRLFVLLSSILTVLKHGGIAVIDEFDVNLHPQMVMELFNLFIHPETNPKNAQLFFSTHSHLVLNQLDKYQLVLVEKDDQGISDAWRLDEMSDVRSDENYYTKYIAGAYGATPRI